ncbi:protein FAR-RED IMPAIRED RESPONSE 1-like [Chenopodium quinoa]|uniref:protein FAR-RED IMPAIRED RESPONSE 1-like n=1 Tax=Chenopodium quinoa TaxID=63459 RepID=UPI000B77B46D|nr:protein FAR-RED IMPAIRED RESPONSE 1-like [Chenopodium quinoa]XP_021758959.1 protein FAR-RED IMPAIRED RESPONSE 1-like [Chenopodium quinoa]
MSCSTDLDVECSPNGICVEVVPSVSPGADGGGLVEGSRVYRTPVRTVETVHTVVSSNKDTVVSYVEPLVEGMAFKTWLDVEAYYKEYAQHTGFGVTRVQGSYTREKERRAMTWRCQCWGRLDMRAVREAKKRAKEMQVCGTGGVVGGVIGEDELSRCKRKSKKCECEARIYASVNGEGVWVIKTAELEHKHLTSPGKAKLVKEYRMKNYSSNVRKKLMNYLDEGVSVRKIHGCLGTEMEENLTMTVKDLQHEVYKERKSKMEGGDSAAMMAYFEYMMADNQNFFHVNRVDSNGRLKDVLWVDSRSRAAYECFGDVVCFDATYLTNEYEFPFINFVGANHHGQSLLLGCALVSHEDSETFRWVFRQWLTCMGGKAPVGFLTDQAAAMRKPLAELMPNTRHRWCIWHILSKFPDKLGKLPLYNEFKNKLKSVVYESFTTEEFERSWTATVNQYNLESNEWLCGLFEERHMWVPAFMKEFFWAGMKTTQRVESINSFFDGFVNRKTRLFEFPRQYTRAMTKRVNDEVAADDNCSKYLRRLISGFKLEKVFQRLYTDTKFQEVQTELFRLMYCYCRDERRLLDNVVQYLLEDRVWIVPAGQSHEVLTDRRRFYRVTFDTSTKEVECDCRKFETFGIMCKHSMRILDQNLVFEIPQKYILT